MKLYKVSYEGKWMGGVAIVLAESEYEAMKLVANDPDTVNPQNMTVELVTTYLNKSRVIYNDAGEY